MPCEGGCAAAMHLSDKLLWILVTSCEQCWRESIPVCVCVRACVRACVCVCVSAAMQVKSESTKPEIHKILQCRQGRTEPFTGNMHIMKFERAV